MSDFVQFKPQDEVLTRPIRFSVTKSAFGLLSGSQTEALSMLTVFSANRILIFTRSKERDFYDVFTSFGTFKCTVADDRNAFLITSFRKNSLMDQNVAMKKGVFFRVESKVIVQIKLTATNMFFDIVDGKQYANNIMELENVSAAITTIQTAINAAYATSPQDSEEEVYKPEKKLQSLLTLSESYSLLSSQLEEKKANEIGKVSYFSVSPLEYDRIDRVMYRFGVRKLDEKNFKAGTQVEVFDKNDQKHSAEIRELVKASSTAPVTAIDLLFSEHIDISEFNRSGFFSLSFSTVNRDVQLAANEKIRTGEAKAKYMDDVFGREITKGFDHKDLSEVKAKLQKKKYPPNASQMKAIEDGINSKDVFLVMGPPGTGKTTVIIEWVKYFVKAGMRVLVSSQNNKAVDNVLARVLEEEDINVIRVGSEAKLQSEIIPCMFENKVSALRDGIAKNTADKYADIDHIIYIWKKFESTIKSIKGISARVSERRNKFVTAVKENFSSNYFTLRNLLNEYNQLQEKKKKYIADINKLSIKINKYEGYNAFFRFLLKFFYKRNIKKIGSVIEEYSLAKKREIAVANQYNQTKPKYDKNLDEIRRKEFSSFYFLLREEQDAVEKANEKPERTADDIWDLFKEARSIQAKNPKDIDRISDEIAKGMDRAKNLKSIMEDWKNEISGRQNYALNEIVLESVDVVGATCIGINSQKRFANLDFDVTIIDEAGQIQVHNALVPMSVSNKLIMLGDHKQIPPTADSDLVALCDQNGVSSELLPMSLFEKMYYILPESNKIMLDTQYRMPGEIADIISEWFYERKYFSPDFKRGLNSLIPKLSAKPFVIVDTSAEANRFEHDIEEAGCDNPLEASIVETLMRHIKTVSENDLKEIGIISGYKSQVALITNKLNKILPEEVVHEMVATLDSYQGQERDIIIYSFAKSSNVSPYKNRIGFLNELRRLNVAMTRCKKMLIMVGDMSFLSGCKHQDKNDAGEFVYDKSEKQFSDFIKKMTADVKNGRGELISYQEFMRRVGR